MKNFIKLTGSVFLIISCILYSCKKGEIPTVTTSEITNIKGTSATCGGTITDEGSGTIIENGVCWGTLVNPTVTNSKTLDGTGTGSFTSSLTQLLPSTKYYVRAYATNSTGTGYGSAMSFTTQEGVIDADGNGYNKVNIGTQEWMAENLKTTVLNDGTSIPNVTSNSDWITLTTPGYCWYNNEAIYKNTYGALYNWYTVNAGILCPTGWHVPTDAEWMVLIEYLGGEQIAGGKLKETGTIHWQSPNTGATNESSFKALPSGDRIGADGSFYNLGSYAIYWSSEQSSLNQAINRVLVFDDTNFRIGYDNKTAGFSVRCVKD